MKLTLRTQTLLKAIDLSNLTRICHLDANFRMLISHLYAVSYLEDKMLVTSIRKRVAIESNLRNTLEFTFYEFS